MSVDVMCVGGPAVGNKNKIRTAITQLLSLMRCCTLELIMDFQCAGCSVIRLLYAVCITICSDVPGYIPTNVIQTI